MIPDTVVLTSCLTTETLRNEDAFQMNFVSRCKTNHYIEVRPSVPTHILILAQLLRRLTLPSPFSMLGRKSLGKRLNSPSSSAATVRAEIWQELRGHS